MPVVKRSISFDAALLREAEDIARAETGGNLSALVAEAIEQRVRSNRLLELVGDMERELGPVPQSVKEEVDRQWRELED